MASPIEKIVPTLEQCKALAPYWKGETVFVWVEKKDKSESGIYDTESYGVDATIIAAHEVYHAPTIQELIDFLGSRSGCDRILMTYENGAEDQAEIQYGLGDITHEEFQEGETILNCLLSHAIVDAYP